MSINQCHRYIGVKLRQDGPFMRLSATHMSGIIRHDVTGEKYLHWLMSSVTRCCNKNSRYVSKSCPKKQFLLESEVFQNAPKSYQISWLLWHENLSPRTFKNRPIWFHCFWDKISPRWSGMTQEWDKIRIKRTFCLWHGQNGLFGKKTWILSVLETFLTEAKFETNPPKSLAHTIARNKPKWQNSNINKVGWITT